MWISQMPKRWVGGHARSHSWTWSVSDTLASFSRPSWMNIKRSPSSQWCKWPARRLPKSESLTSSCAAWPRSTSAKRCNRRGPRSKHTTSILDSLDTHIAKRAMAAFFSEGGFIFTLWAREHRRKHKCWFGLLQRGASRERCLFCSACGPSGHRLNREGLSSASLRESITSLRTPFTTWKVKFPLLCTQPKTDAKHCQKQVRLFKYSYHQSKGFKHCLSARNMSILMMWLMCLSCDAKTCIYQCQGLTSKAKGPKTRTNRHEHSDFRKFGDSEVKQEN